MVHVHHDQYKLNDDPIQSDSLIRQEVAMNLVLQEYDFIIRYRKGSQNSNMPQDQQMRRLKCN